MKHVLYFNDFLAGHVNLNQSRLDKLKKSVKTITDLLKYNLGGYQKYSTQGSYAHETIIKPVQDNDEFDADILVFIQDNDFAQNRFVTDYVDAVYDTFKDNDNYKNKIQKNTRCVTIDYAGDFHLDIVPCIEHDGTDYICNRRDKTYEKTDGDGYKGWVIGKNSTVGGNNFKKTTRLLKFLRDHKDNFSVKSILLTTMLGNEVRFYENFPDLPTTLKTFSSRVNDFLIMNSAMPTVRNPVLPEEDFNRHWDQIKYRNFQEKFNSYNTKIHEAFEEKDHDKSVIKWRKLFGDGFGKLKSNSTTSTAIPIVGATKPYAQSD